MIWKKKKSQQKQMEIHLSPIQLKLLERLVASLGNCMLDEEARYYIFFPTHGCKAPKKITILEKK